MARALWLESRASRMLGLANIDPREAAAFAIEYRAKWARATWRQVKASLVYRYDAMGSAEALEAVQMLMAETQAPCAVRTGNTSGLRKKGAREQELARILVEIRQTRSKYKDVLESWLVLGVLTGLRPHEWGQTTLIYAKPSEIYEDAKVPEEEDLIRAFLEVENSKATNGRSHGPRRHLDISALPPASLEAISDFATGMRNVHSAGDYPNVYSGCQVLLARINRSLGYVGDRKRIQIYSPRHRFSSDAKKALSLEQVAALMGHATNRTATRHYGLQTAGGSGFAVRPVALEVGRVRLAYKPRPPEQTGGLGIGVGKKRAPGAGGMRSKRSK